MTEKMILNGRSSEALGKILPKGRCLCPLQATQSVPLFSLQAALRPPHQALSWDSRQASVKLKKFLNQERPNLNLLLARSCPNVVFSPRGTSLAAQCKARPEEWTFSSSLNKWNLNMTYIKMKNPWSRIKMLCIFIRCHFKYCSPSISTIHNSVLPSERNYRVTCRLHVCFSMQLNLSVFWGVLWKFI